MRKTDKCALILVPRIYDEYIGVVMGKVGRPRLEESTTSAIRMPVRLWRLLSKASEEYRTRNELIIRLAEDHLVKKGLLADEDRRFPISVIHNKRKA